MTAGCPKATTVRSFIQYEIGEIDDRDWAQTVRWLLSGQRRHWLQSSTKTTACTRQKWSASDSLSWQEACKAAFKDCFSEGKLFDEIAKLPGLLHRVVLCAKMTTTGLLLLVGGVPAKPDVASTGFI